MQFNEDIPLKLKLIQDSVTSWIRRIRIAPSVVSGVLLSHVRARIEEFTNTPFSLEYIDDERDTILMSTEEEWTECLNIFYRMCQTDPSKPLTLLVRPTTDALPPAPSLAPSIDLTQKKSKTSNKNHKKKRPQNIAKQMLTKHFDGARVIRKAFRQQLKSMNASAKLEIAQIKKAKRPAPHCGLTKELPGKYESHIYDGTPHKNEWCFVTVTFNSFNNTFTWGNNAGNQWILYPVHDDPTMLLVDAGCPYYKEGHRSVSIRRDADGTIESLIGPREVVYSRQSFFTSEICAERQTHNWVKCIEQLQAEREEEEQRLQFLSQIENQHTTFEEKQFHRELFPEEVEEALRDEEALLLEQELLARESLLLEEEERKEAEEQRLLEQVREIEEHIRLEKIEERKLAVLREAQEHERELHLDQQTYSWEQLLEKHKEQLTFIENKARNDFPAEITKLTAMGFSVGPDILDLLRKHEGNLNVVITSLLS
eukprot:TRINITY_DN5906_c2_g1_i1.p1 TRINITY_DN5906_c2_g1~~TRINITY_DN5906_c2_g1_i1.p1  ORF type:complete len:483 (+),score=128.90 TRINITY_DN5906_c2_g1_i1:59-1507(+)